MEDKKFKSEWSSVKWSMRSIPPATCSAALCVLVHETRFWLVWFYDISCFWSHLPRLMGPAPCPLSSPYIAWIVIAFLIYATSIHELLAFSCLKQWWPFLLWNDISTCSLSPLFSLFEMFCMSCMKSSNSFDTWPPRLLTAQFSFTFWCYVTLSCSKKIYLK